MPDYIEHDNGKILRTYISVDPSQVKGKAVIEVSRETAKAVTKYHKVADGKLVEMNAQEKSALDAAEAQAAKDAKLADIDAMNITAGQIAKALIGLGVVTDKQLKDRIKADEGLSVIAP